MVDCGPARPHRDGVALVAEAAPADRGNEPASVRPGAGRHRSQPSDALSLLVPQQTRL